MSLLRKLLKESYEIYTNTQGDDFWGDIGAGILPYSITTKRFLLNHRSDYVNEPDHWGIWGGQIHVEEDNINVIKKEALREFKEESKFTKNINLDLIYIFETNSKSFKYYNFIGIIDDEFTPKLDWESKGFEWVTYEELISISNNDVDDKEPHFGLTKLIKNGINKIDRLI